MASFVSSYAQVEFWGIFRNLVHSSRDLLPAKLPEVFVKALVEILSSDAADETFLGILSETFIYLVQSDNRLPSNLEFFDSSFIPQLTQSILTTQNQGVIPLALSIVRAGLTKYESHLSLEGKVKKSFFSANKVLFSLAELHYFGVSVEDLNLCSVVERIIIIAFFNKTATIEYSDLMLAEYDPYN